MFGNFLATSQVKPPFTSIVISFMNWESDGIRGSWCMLSGVIYIYMFQWYKVLEKISRVFIEFSISLNIKLVKLPKWAEESSCILVCASATLKLCTVCFFHHSGPTWGGPSNLLFCSCLEIGGCLTTVDGWNPAPVEVGSFSHYLSGFIHPQMVEDFFHHQYDQIFSSRSFDFSPLVFVRS